MSRQDEVLIKLQLLSGRNPQGVNAKDIAHTLNINRSTASRYLNDLVEKGKAEKIPGKPVCYQIKNARFSKEVGDSIQPLIQQGVATLSYPFQSLHILLDGETGTGKTYLADQLYEIAAEEGYIKRETPFVTFNCADYAQNPELLVGQIFGIKKGAYTGALHDQTGLVDHADGGILFLDEIHRLPSSGQEMLFYLIDKGVYRRLGEAVHERKAKITIIGATSEQPDHALLPTLLRRFPVKLTVPPLRARSDKERKMMIDQFLQQEADKMDADLSIEAKAKEALIRYPCPGNIGQLKNDIQIACAKAYLQYLNQNAGHVNVCEKDVPTKFDGMKSTLITNNNHLSSVSTIGKIHEGDPAFPLPNIYQRLNKKRSELYSMGEVTIEYSLQQVVNQYIQDLSDHYPKDAFSYDALHDLVDQDLLQALQRAPKVLSNPLSKQLDETSIYVIGLHLQNFRNEEHQDKHALPSFPKAKLKDQKAAYYLADFLADTIDFNLPDSEVDLLAHFLTPEDELPLLPKRSGQSIYVLLVTHGRSTATSMAEVTNTLLGTTVIESIDMPLEKSAEKTYEEVKINIEKAFALNAYQGVLLLVDMGSLVTLGDTFYNEWDIPVLTLPCVNMPIVMEAGRKSLVQDATIEDVYESAHKAMTLFMRDHDPQPQSSKKRMIATVCFTGEGAAQILEEWLADQLTKADEDVVIRSVRINPVSRDTSMLHQLKEYYDIVAIIGTVFISIDEIPFIPAWELLKQDGTSRLVKLLEMTRRYKHLSEDNHTHKVDQEGYFDIQSGLAEIVTFINPHLFCTILNKYLPQIKSYYDWDESRELGMAMHIGVLLDRIMKAHLNDEIQELQKTIPLDNDCQYDKEERTVWEPLISSLEQTFEFPIPDSFIRATMKLSK